MTLPTGSDGTVGVLVDEPSPALVAVRRRAARATAAAPRRPDGRRSAEPRWRFAALALALLVGLTACGGDGGRDQAVADLVAAGWSEAEAACYVDATIQVAGTAALDSGAELTPERLDALYQVASTCRLTADEPLALDESIGFGELTERDLNDAISEMTDEELIEWAALYGFDAGPLAADIADLRDRALDDLTITRGFELTEAQCIIDFLYRRLGKAGLDLGAAPTAEVADTEAAAIAACAPGG